MPQKTALVQTRVPPEIRAKLEAVAGEAGLTVSGLLRLLIDNVVSKEEAPTPKSLPSKSRREGKVTARLPRGVREDLEAEAKRQGVTASSWVAAILQTRYRKAPYMLDSERRGTRRALRQLRGLSVNVNQIAHALNRGLLTGAGAELTRDELMKFRDDVADLRKALSAYAGGRYKVLTATWEGDDDKHHSR
ncbi:MobC family plasmid mobilization relaxosome protein [Celeribacter sp. SCSIO 80788]|uniref:MobC family plasmid mobilization relaxosome protein n=1 Tax=Celeribacter sp. SCSIO 80788 TaxID=3117013 RepID=UPI003DA42165